MQRSGNHYHICAPFFEQKTLNKMNDELNYCLIQYVNKTDLNKFFDEKIKVILNKKIHYCNKLNFTVGLVL